MAPMIACCGFRCHLCAAHLDNNRCPDDQVRTATGWSKYFGLNMSPEKIMCHGCLSDPCSGSDLPEKNCPIRPCVLDRGLDNCAYCPDYPCEKMETRMSSYEEVARRFQGVIPQAEYDKFIAPHDSRKTLNEIGPQKGKR